MQRPSTSASDGSEGGVNVQVAVRCRPLNEQERTRNTVQVVSAIPDRRQVKINYGTGAKRVTKTFTFDRVFGQYATQDEVFRETVLPIVDEALQGYNCTVFAYGQTGTGKTHTMEGDIHCPEQAGIIPRTVRAIFEKLDEIRADYSVRVSFLELYNEELQDLLAVNTTHKKPLRLCEDSKRGVTCQNLEEIHVLNADSIFEILARGIEQRQTAATNCNKNSSRSHSIFTLKIMIKELADDGNEAIRHGQLNLVDLAGSECIGRSGAKDQRAREAGNINQSLLTLGRVITALVDHHGHVPYRDSKLTRLLQESLGGRAKTCIIATLSPAADAVDESMSTLDYAHRAKNIRNKPEINQKLSKTAAMREQAVENEQLRLELQAQREKNGVYLPVSVYEQMQTTISSQEAQIAEAESALKSRKQELKQLQDECNEMLTRLEEQQQHLAEAEQEVAAKKQALAETRSKLVETAIELAASNAVVDEQVVTEDFLADTMEGFREEIVTRRDEVTGLQAKIGRFENYQNDRIQMADEFCQDTEVAADKLQSSVRSLLAHSEEQSTVLCEGVAELLARGKETCDVMTTAISAALDKLQQDSRQISTEMKTSCTSLEQRLFDTNDNVATTLQTLQQSLGTWISDVDSSMQQVQSALAAQQKKTAEIAKSVEKNCASNVKLLKKFMKQHSEKVAQLEGELAALQQSIEQQSTAHQQDMQQYVVTQQAELQAQAQALMQQMTTMLSAFSTQAQTAFTQLHQMGGAHAQQVAAQVSESVQQMRTEAAAVNQLSEDNIAKVMEATSAIQATTAEGLQAVSGHRETAAAHISGIQENVAEKLQHLQTSVTTLTQSVAASIDAGRGEVAQTAAMAEKLVVGVQGAAKSMQDNASGAVNSFNAFMEQHGDVLQDSLHEHFEHLQTQLHDQGHTIADVKESTITFQAKASQGLQATGTTPKPKAFQSLAKLRRTRDHEEIRSEVRSTANPTNFPGMLPFGADDEEDTENVSPASSSRSVAPANKRRKSGDSHLSLGSTHSNESVRPLRESSNWAL